MDRVYAFTDESGAFGWDLENPSVSTHFIISAVIVKEQNLEVMRKAIDLLRQKHFRNSEIKSSNIGKNHDRRRKILSEVLQLPFSIFTVILDKSLVKRDSGLHFKESFYKFLNNIVHEELRQAFYKLTIVADTIGGSEYMKSFSKYVEEKQDIPNLFGEAEFYFKNSKNDVLIQLADLISGTFAHEYDLHKASKNPHKYSKMLESKIIRTEFYPKTYETYILENSPLSKKYDKEISTVCFKQAINFINKYKNNNDPDIKAQLIVLKYLLFRFMNNNLNPYISTKELKKQLAYASPDKINDLKFRTKIIAKLRDNRVIISSSSAGYKIPTSKSDLFDFINHGATIIMPMLDRLGKCRDLIKLSTINELDLFDNAEYEALRKYFDN